MQCSLSEPVVPMPTPSRRAYRCSEMGNARRPKRQNRSSATHLSEFIFQNGNLPFILFLENIIHKGGLTGLLAEERRRKDGIRMRWDSENEAGKRQHDGSTKRRRNSPRLILTPRKPVTTVMGVRSESASDIVANNGLRTEAWRMGYYEIEKKPHQRPTFHVECRVEKAFVPVPAALDGAAQAPLYGFPAVHVLNHLAT